MYKKCKVSFFGQVAQAEKSGRKHGYSTFIWFHLPCGKLERYFRVEQTLTKVSEATCPEAFYLRTETGMSLGYHCNVIFEER